MFEWISERVIDKWTLLSEIRDSIFSLYGDVGASESKRKTLIDEATQLVKIFSSILQKSN